VATRRADDPQGCLGLRKAQHRLLAAGRPPSGRRSNGEMQSSHLLVVAGACRRQWTRKRLLHRSV
jgi:hypothetical protein